MYTKTANTTNYTRMDKVIADQKTAYWISEALEKLPELKKEEIFAAYENDGENVGFRTAWRMICTRVMSNRAYLYASNDRQRIMQGLNRQGTMYGFVPTDMFLRTSVKKWVDMRREERAAIADWKEFKRAYEALYDAAVDEWLTPPYVMEEYVTAWRKMMAHPTKFETAEEIDYYPTDKAEDIVGFMSSVREARGLANA